MERVKTMIEFLDDLEAVGYLDDELPELLRAVGSMAEWEMEDPAPNADEELTEILGRIARDLVAGAKCLSRARVAIKRARRRIEQLEREPQSRGDA